MSLGSDNANWSMERLVEIRELKGKVADLETEIYELLEENERLRKAGTYLCSTAEVNGISKNGDLKMHERALAFWREAAKGVQS